MTAQKKVTLAAVTSLRARTGRKEFPASEIHEAYQSLCEVTGIEVEPSVDSAISSVGSLSWRLGRSQGKHGSNGGITVYAGLQSAHDVDIDPDTDRKEAVSTTTPIASQTPATDVDTADRPEIPIIWLVAAVLVGLVLTVGVTRRR